MSNRVSRTYASGALAVVVSARRLIALALAAALCLTPTGSGVEVAAAVPGQAASADGRSSPSGPGQISQEQALRIAVEAFPPPPGLPAPEVSMTSLDGSPVYSVWWRGGRLGASQSVWVEPRSGQILLMSRGLGPASLQTRGEPLPEVDLRAAAEALVRRLLPDRWPSLREFDHADSPLLPVPGTAEFGFGGGPLTSQYQVSFVEMIGGVPFPERRVRVGLDRQTGEVVLYKLDWPAEVPLAAGTAQVSADRAAASLRSGLGLELAYLAVRDGPGLRPAEFIPVWRPRLQQVELDAVSGAFRDTRGADVDPDALAAGVAVPSAGGDAGTAPAGRLGRDDARALARRLLGLPADLAPRFEADRGWPPGDSSFYFYWEVEQPPKGVLTYQVSVDPELGVLSSVSRGAPKAAVLDPGIGLGDNEQVPNIGEAAAREKAVALVARWYPRLAGQLRLRGAAEVRRIGFGPVRLDGYVFAFERVANGIPVIGDGVQVSIEAKTGQWLSADVRWSRGEFPPVQVAVDRERAEEVFFGQREAVLMYGRATAPTEPYAPASEGGGSHPGARAPAHGSARLLYRLFPRAGVPAHLAGVAVSARTGKLVDAFGREVDQLAAAYGELATHWARRELEAMVERGALTAIAGDPAPDRPLSRIEALQLLVGGYFYQQGASRSTSPWTDLPREHPLFAYAAAALDLGLIDPPAGNGATLRPDEPVSRAEFALLAARALGLGPLVRSALDVTPPFSDVAGHAPDVRRAVALLAALDVVRGNDGRFRPDDPVRRAEGAVWVVRLLVAQKT